MLNHFMEKTFYGNTILDWLYAFGLIILAITIGKAIYWAFGKFIKQYTKKTKTRLDDIIIDMIEEPLVFAVTIVGIWLALGTLKIPDIAGAWLSKIYYVLIIFNVAWFMNRLFSSLIQEYLVPYVENTKTDLDDQLLPFIQKGIKLAIWVTAAIIALNNAGYDVGAVIAGLGIGSLAFALAAKDTIANLFGGLTILLDKPFKINQRVQIEGYDGTITEIGLRSTRLTTQFDGRVVTIPNSKFASNAVVNVSSEPSRNITLNLSLAYNIDEHKVKLAMNLLKEIARDNVNVEDKVTISFNSFEAHSLNILFMYRIKKESNIFETQSEINLQILSRFRQSKLAFAIPSRIIYQEGWQQDQTNKVRPDIFSEVYHGTPKRIEEGRANYSSAQGHALID